MTHSSFFSLFLGFWRSGVEVFDVHAHSGVMWSVSALGVVEGSGKSGRDRSQRYVCGWRDPTVEQGPNVVKICVQGEEVDWAQFSPDPGMRMAEVRVIAMPF